MEMLLLIAAAITPPVLVIALYRTRLWWLGGIVLYVASAAYWLFVRPHDDDSLFSGFELFVDDVAAFVLAIYGTVMLGISTLIHQLVVSQRRLAGTRSSAPASRRTPAPRRSSDT